MSSWCAQPLAVSRRSVAITNDWRNPKSKTSICSRLVGTPYMTTDVVWYLVWALSSLCMCCPTLPGPPSAVSVCNMLQLMMLCPWAFKQVVIWVSACCACDVNLVPTASARMRATMNTTILSIAIENMCQNFYWNGPYCFTQAIASTKRYQRLK